MSLKLPLATAILLFSLPCLAADPSYWVTYQVDASVRKLPATAWSSYYSAPFGVAVGYGTGVIFNDPTATDPTQPNCFDFSFSPKLSNGLTSLRQEITVTEYRGDNLCSPLDPTQVDTLAVIDVMVEQKQADTYQFPFFDGQQIQVNLSQSWAVPQGAPAATLEPLR